MRWSLRYLCGVVALGLALGCAPVAAQDYKIGIVDLQRAASTSPQAEAARNKIDLEFRDRDRQLIAMQKDLRAMEEELVRDRNTMSAERLERLNRDLRRDRREFQRALSEFNEDRNVRNNDELRELQNEVIAVTQQVAIDEKYDLVLIRGIVVFADEAKMDMTERVIDRLKRQFQRDN